MHFGESKKTFANFATISYNCTTTETSAKGRGLYINPLTDFGLKKIFGNGEVMRAFLNDLLEPASEMNFRLDGLAPRTRRTVKLKVKETGEVFTETTRTCLLELPDYVGAPPESCTTKADEWLYNIANMSTMDTRKIPCGDRQPAMKRMFDIAEVANMTPAEAGSYDIGFGSWLSSRDSCDTAQRKGVEYGLAKGKAEALTGIAREVIEEVKRKTTC